MSCTSDWSPPKKCCVPPQIRGAEFSPTAWKRHSSRGWQLNVHQGKSIWICISPGATICTMHMKFQLDRLTKNRNYFQELLENLLSSFTQKLLDTATVQRALERLLETSGKMRLIFSLLSIVSPLASTGHIYWHQPASGLALGKYLALFLWELKRYLWFITEFCANAAKQNLMC